MFERNQSALKQLLDHSREVYYPSDCATIEKTIDSVTSMYRAVSEDYSYEKTASSLCIAQLLISHHCDVATVVAGVLLIAFESNCLDECQLKETYSPEVANIVIGAYQMSILRNLQNNSADKLQINKYKKMLLAIIEDVRIVLVKLAERLCCLRKLGYDDGQAKNSIAIEVLDIFAPLASRLGLLAIKQELEDRSLQLLHPEDYHRIESQLQTNGTKKQRQLNDLICSIKRLINQEQIQADINGRVKHIYSIWKKMQKKQYDMSQLYDITAIRILVSSVSQCYKALSLIHQHYEMLQSEYSDYIAVPKPNGYQSIHTVILDQHNIPVEVQIRTYEMHQESESGVAAHWQYKEGGSETDQGYQEKIKWLRTLLDWQQQLSKQSEYYDKLKDINKPIVEQQVYAFTPKGDVVDLPVGSTVLDFAYNIHTMVGHRCRGAKVNNRIVPLTYKVQTGDKVDILTHKTPAPGKDWMYKNKGFVYSSKIRNIISKWFKQQHKETYARLGRERLLLELKNRRLKKIDFEKVARHFNMSDEQTFYAALYAGDLRFNQVLHYIEYAYQVAEGASAIKDKDLSETNDTSVADRKSDVIIQGVDGLLTNMADCCKPVFGDDISGYITREKGVSIHRSNCKNLLNLKREHPERIIDISWGEGGSNQFLVDLRILVKDPQVVNNIKGLLTANNIEIVSIKQLKQDNNGLHLQARIGISNLEDVRSVVKKAASIRGLVSIERQGG